MKNKKRAVTIGILLALVAAVLMLTNVGALLKAQTAAAPQSGNTPRRAPASVAPLVAGVNHVLKGTFINSCIPTGCPTIALAAGTFVALDAPTTISCPAPLGHTCTITVDAWAQLQNNTANGNNGASINLVLDGAALDTYFSGSTGSPNAFFYDGLVNRTDLAINVARGSHTVQTEVRSQFGGNAAGWAATYRVYAP